MLKVILSIAFLFKCAIGLSFLAIPTGRFIDTYPINISLAVGCQSSPDGNLILKDLDSVDCDFKPTNNLSLTLEECGVICFDSKEEEKTTIDDIKYTYFFGTVSQVSLESNLPNIYLRKKLCAFYLLCLKTFVRSPS